MKNDNLMHSPMYSYLKLLLFNSKFSLSMAMGFWHDTTHNSYVSPCKIPLCSSFPADPPKKFCSWLPFPKYNKASANRLRLSSLVQ